MDINLVIGPVIAALVGLLVGWAGALKNAAPRLIESKLKEREAQIMEAAEKAAYERNRKATQEDRTFEMLHDTLEFIQDRTVKDFDYRKERIAADDDFRERQLALNEKLVEGLRELGFKYHNLSGNQSITNQHLAIMTDDIREIKTSIGLNKRDR